jgi:MarR family transcriptional regulator, organic hydroperoxide resistance regulator
MSIRRGGSKVETLSYPAIKSGRPASKTAKERSLHAPRKEYGAFHEIIWDIVSIHSNLEDMRRHWARKFGVSGPQWMIMMAINDLDQGGGVPVGEVSAKIHAVSTFVTTQTKLLEQRGLLTRVSSTADARVVLLSLSDRAHKEISQYFGQWGELHDFMFADFDAAALRIVQQKLESLKKRTEIASRRVADDL